MTTGGATRAMRPHRRPFDLLAIACIGVAIVAAALFPAFTANAGGTKTIRGDITVDGDAVPFIRVGFWSPTEGVIAHTEADAGGRFTLDVPDAVDGYAYAGAEPNATDAITGSGAAAVVRGIIGAKAAKHASTPLYQGWAAATAENLAGGKAQLHFKLQRPGRITGSSPIAANRVQAIQVRRLDQSVVQRLSLDSHGHYRSEPLAPGIYAVALVPKAPDLPQAVRAVVESGQTVTASPAAPVTGGTVRGTVTAGGKAAGRSVPVLLLRDGAQVATTTTSTSGEYRFSGLPAGQYTVTAGQFAVETGTTGSAPTPVPIPDPSGSPTASPTPTSSPTPTPTPSPTQATGPDAVLQPVVRTADTVLPASVSAELPEVLGEVEADVAAEAAGQIDGTVTGAMTGAPVQVVAEDLATRGILRSTTADPGTGEYLLGGLTPGVRYRVYAVDRPTDLTQARYGGATIEASAGTPSSADITIEKPALHLVGSLSGATSGSVVVGDAAVFSRSAMVDSAGAYAVNGLVPAVYAVSGVSTGRLPASPVAVSVLGSATQDLAAGPRPATYKAWFISAGAGAPQVGGTASDAQGDLVRIGPRLPDGQATVHDLTPGTYSYDPESFVGSVPVTNGPWWFAPPVGTFTLRDGATTDVGPVVLHVKAR